MQKSLARLPYVNSVTYYPNYGRLESDNQILLNAQNHYVFIVLEMPKLTEDSFLISRNMNIKINCFASNSIPEILSGKSSNYNSENQVSFNIQSELQHSSRTIFIECPGTKYEIEAKNVSQELSNAIKNQFTNLLNKYNEPESKAAYVTNVETTDSLSR